jgi:uncharacterized damage-inducible protein DinB
MTLAERIANHIERAIAGPMWHGACLRELLAPVTPEQARAHPIPGAHSIWELVLHMAAWAEVARLRLRGEPGEPTPEEDWPPVSHGSVDEWAAALARLEASYFGLAHAVSVLDDDTLRAPLVGRDHSAAVMLHGVVEHAAYHGGQIALLRKAAMQQGHV